MTEQETLIKLRLRAMTRETYLMVGVNAGAIRYQLDYSGKDTERKSLSIPETTAQLLLQLETMTVKG